MAIPAEIIDRVRLGTDIVELAREYIPALKKSGRNWKANCPFHNEKTPSFMINAEKGIFHCFGCGAGGDAFKLVMMMDGVNWPEAVKKLGGRLGIVIKETREEAATKSEKQKIYDLLEQAADFYHRCLKDSKEGEKALHYLEKRGVNSKSVENFLIGFSPKNSLINSAEKKGFSKDQLVSAGLITKTDRGNYFEYMSERLVFPIADSQGRVVAFGGRALKDEEPKYLNTPETSVYSKSNQLYGLFQAIPALRKSGEIMILEGYMDVVVAHQFGVENCVATMGTSLTSQHSQLIRRYCESVILMFDSDNAGTDAAKRAIEMLLDSDVSINVAGLPEGIDPDEYLLKEGREKFLKFIETEKKSFIEFLTGEALKKFPGFSVEAKVKAVGEVLPYIEKVKNSVLKSELLKYISEKFKVREDALVAELRRQSKRPARSSETDKGAEKKKGFVKVRSAEEELIQIIINHPELAVSIDESLVKNGRDLKVLTLLKAGSSAAEISDALDESDRAWFRELLLEEKEYDFPEQTISNIVREMKNKELELERKRLEDEIILMRSGRIPHDDKKFELYKELTAQLKGSGTPR